MNRNRLPDYKRATNATYELLAQREEFSISTDLIDIINELSLNCVLLTYKEMCLRYKKSHDLLLEVSEYGFSFVHGNRRIILYNEDALIGCVRFTIAHEIGHACLGHKKEDDPIAEKEANCFARNLLCPAPVADSLSLESAEQYVDAFRVTSKAATVAIDKRNVDRYYANEDLSTVLFNELYAFMSGYCSLKDFYNDIYRDYMRFEYAG